MQIELVYITPDGDFYSISHHNAAEARAIESMLATRCCKVNDREAFEQGSASLHVPAAQRQRFNRELAAHFVAPGVLVYRVPSTLCLLPHTAGVA